MLNDLMRFAFSDRMVRAAHWTVFSLGAVTLAFSIAATAASAL